MKGGMRESERVKVWRVRQRRKEDVREGRGGETVRIVREENGRFRLKERRV